MTIQKQGNKTPHTQTPMRNRKKLP